MVIPADLDRLALHGEQLRHNRFLIARQRLRNRDKLRLQRRILINGDRFYRGTGSRRNPSGPIRKGAAPLRRSVLKRNPLPIH
jgi:hypothetical protein